MVLQSNWQCSNSSNIIAINNIYGKFIFYLFNKIRLIVFKQGHLQERDAPELTYNMNKVCKSSCEPELNLEQARRKFWINLGWIKHPSAWKVYENRWSRVSQELEKMRSGVSFIQTWKPTEKS